MDANSGTGKQKDRCLMETHFLKPYVTSIDGPVAELPRHRSSVSSSDLKDSFSRISFTGFWFPNANSRRCISRHVFPIAVRLARGEKVALAPAVLASIYRDLGHIQAFAREKSTQNLSPKSLFKLVQVWAWERFRNIRPEAREVRRGEPRIAQWSRLNQKYAEKESLSFDDFEWRPYTKPLDNWKLSRLYLEEAKWVTIDDDLDDEFVSFARCVRSSQLVGIGFVEGYYPNRVAMQFGLSQDLPGLVSDHSSFTEQEAWDDYNKSLVGLKLYVPSRLATTSVTVRYRDWWLKSVSGFLGSPESTETFNARNTADDDDVSLKVMLQEIGKEFSAKLKRCRKRRTAKQMGSEIKKGKTGDCGASALTEVPLSELFQKELAKRTSEHLRDKRRKGAREYDDDDSNRMDCYDEITIAQLIKSRSKTEGDGSVSLGKRRRHEEDSNGSRIFQELASGDDETVAPQETKQRSEEYDEEETGSKAEEISVLIPSDGNKSPDPLLDVNGGIDNIVVSPPETRQNCDDEVYVSGVNAEKNRTIVGEGTKEVECLVHVHEDGEKQRDDDDERSKQRKLAIYELAANLEARIMKAEKTSAKIRKWKTERNHIKTGVSA
ncbi:unnamed protein product [Thlaspi arvense]|uniref:Aminotransferase-like plant mobile domain-containing protein n=1 Tax=Thlaspi arvense TaxID=13288 RepID=A0AAU9R9A4_THLAR|nr:unnamed protein product [Thlaspi arvense]